MDTDALNLSDVAAYLVDLATRGDLPDADLRRLAECAAVVGTWAEVVED